MSSQPAIASDQLELASAQNRISRVALLIVLLGCSAVATALSLQFFPVFGPPAELLVPSPPDEIAVAREASFWNCRLANSQLLITGVVAAIAGGLWAVIGARQTRKEASLMLTFLSGAVVAAAICAIAIFVGHLIMEFRVDPDYEMHRSVASQVTWMSIFGVGLGAALGIGQGTKQATMQYTMNGFAAGIVAAVLYVVITATAMTNSQTDILVPGGTLNGSKDIALLAVWFGVMAFVFSMIIPKPARKARP